MSSDQTRQQGKLNSRESYLNPRGVVYDVYLTGQLGVVGQAEGMGEI